MQNKLTKYIFNKHNILVLVFFLFTNSLFAQNIAEEKLVVPNDSTKEQKTTLVQLIQSDQIKFDQKRLPDVQIIEGNVVFKHDSAYMHCDSAYFYTKESSFDAFGKVRIEEGDSVSIYGDFLYYDGNTKMARLRNNVRMETNTTTLTTDSMNYDRVADLAYYYTGGKLKDEENTLTSIWGQYSSGTKKAVFKDSVRLLNKSFVLKSDSLLYDTETHVASIVSDTHILTEDTTNVYTRSGWYDTDQERAMLLERSLIVRPDGVTVVGDTLFYDKGKQMVEGISNVEMKDTVNKATVLADYVFFDEAKESGYACDSLLLIDWSTPDSLFVHSDTIFIEKDSTYDVMRAYRNVRFYKSDLQGACDSLVYLERDSAATLYGEPVIWAGENQLSGSIIKAFFNDSTVERFYIPESSMAVQAVDDKYYNQLAGKEMDAFVKDGDLKLVKVKGNCQTIYCPVDDKDSLVITVNKTESGFVDLHFTDDQKIDRIVLLGTPSGEAFPITDISGDDLYVNQFFWIEEQRPRKKQDVFLCFPSNRHASSIVHVVSAASEDKEEPDEEPEEDRGTRNRNSQGAGFRSQQR